MSAVVICLDRNKLAESESGPPAVHLYEAEAVECVRSWRDNARWTEEIYAVQYEGREVSDTTLRRLSGMGVQTITRRLPSGIKRPFMEVVYALSLAERGDFAVKGRILYSDLDVVMRKPVPSMFFEPGRAVLYYYPDGGADAERDSPEFRYRMSRCRALGIRCHNTYFQAFDAGGAFQQTALALAESAEYLDFFEHNVYYRPTDDDYFFEEGIYDYVCLSRGNQFSCVDVECPSEFFDHAHVHARLLKHGQKTL